MNNTRISRVILRKDAMSIYVCVRVYIFIAYYLSHTDDVTFTMYSATLCLSFIQKMTL